MEEEGAGERSPLVSVTGAGIAKYPSARVLAQNPAEEPEGRKAEA